MRAPRVSVAMSKVSVLAHCYAETAADNAFVWLRQQGFLPL
jgi:hypothetical protein